MVQDGEDSNSRGPDNIEDEVRKSRDHRAPDIVVYDGIGLRVSAHCIESVAYRRKKLFAESATL
jgi:hypothetical protein